MQKASCHSWNALREDKVARAAPGIAKGNEGRNEHSLKGFVPIVPPVTGREQHNAQNYFIPRFFSSLGFYYYYPGVMGCSR